ncbi:hypothetical protein AAG570_001532 [Ranatra chinensis]|uniref:Alpha N-terminal protein methyltransferase 1 n=1 Tax=Ranatra chinensis TaxID=642074 RepID=A0ABD0Y9L3_9HEMI
MLGGFGHISKNDIKGSENFLQMEGGPGRGRALDCGCGIGRISKNLLVRYFDKVDLVDQCRQFIDKAADYVSSNRVGELYCCGLQEFKPVLRYDVIWCQWVLGHLTDDHFIQFMNNCKEGLKENGVIVVKENIASGDGFDKDDTDSSVTRPLPMLEALFAKSNLSTVRVVDQSRFPKGLYPVKMIALRPT